VLLLRSFMKERVAEQKTELEIKAEKFLDLLYHYDFVGKDAYFKKEKPEIFKGSSHIFNRKDYGVVKGRKYIWLVSPYLNLGITKEGYLFKPKKYWTFGYYFTAGKIDEFLDPDLWGKSIYRVHTSARRGTAPGESAVMHYYDLRFDRPRHIKSTVVENTNKNPNVVMISDTVAEMKEIWRDFVVGLGYNEEQGGKFAQGYADKLATLPMFGKLKALNKQEPECMSAGFEAAGIDEDEALRRFKEREGAIDVTAR